MKFKLVESLEKEYDSLGNELSDEQIKFFRNSAIRDNSGNLLVCYHATDASFTTFKLGDIGFHFGHKEAAEDRKRYHKKWNIKECYLNIINPFIVDDDYGSCDGWSIAVNWLFGASDGYEDWRDGKTELPQYNLDLVPREFLSDIEEIKIIAKLDMYELQRKGRNSKANTRMRELFKKHGFDGIKYMNECEGPKDYSYIAFYPNQIKLISNKNPTNSNDMTEEIV